MSWTGGGVCRAGLGAATTRFWATGSSIMEISSAVGFGEEGSAHRVKSAIASIITKKPYPPAEELHRPDHPVQHFHSTENPENLQAAALPVISLEPVMLSSYEYLAYGLQGEEFNLLEFYNQVFKKEISETIVD